LAYSVNVSEQAEKTLFHISRKNKSRCRDLALLLLNLEKNPRPRGSRILKDIDKDSSPSPEAREWQIAKTEILYEINDTAKTINIALINLPKE
jgi:hypothetical protein